MRKRRRNKLTRALQTNVLCLRGEQSRRYTSFAKCFFHNSPQKWHLEIPQPFLVQFDNHSFLSYYLEWGGGRKRDPSYKSIPCFYTPLPPEDDLLLQKLREESRAGNTSYSSGAIELKSES